MQKLLALAMAAMLLLSTTGVTVASMTCVRSGHPVKTCHHCEHSRQGVSLRAKSCCVASTHRIAVEDSFAQPPQPVILVPVSGAVDTIRIAGSQVPAPHISAIDYPTSTPFSAREYCALTSIFRI